VTLSHPDNHFHIAATAQIAYAEPDTQGTFRIGAYFITLHPHDKVKIAESVKHSLNI